MKFLERNKMYPFNSDTQSFAWAIGIIEGEGWIGSDNTDSNARPRIEVEMSDFDVIQRMQNTFGGNVYFRPSRFPEYKPMWRWSLNKQKDVYQLLQNIEPFMSERRQAKIHEVIARYNLRRKPDAIH